MIRADALARWTEQLLCAFVTDEPEYLKMTDGNGDRPYFTPAMKEEVLMNAIKATREMANDATKLFGKR